METYPVILPSCCWRPVLTIMLTIWCVKEDVDLHRSHLRKAGINQQHSNADANEAPEKQTSATIDQNKGEDS